MAGSKAGLNDVGLLLLRIAGIGLAVHGWPKMAAAFASLGSESAPWGFVDSVRKLGFPQPVLFAWAAAVAEFVGGIAVALGIYTRVFAATAAFTMGVAAFLKHSPDGFDKRELALLYLVVHLGLLCLGGGSLTVDSFWRKK
mgnify:CR=1 FL=1